MTDTATLAGGCFWCIEAAMKELDGVESVTSGYSGGTVADPTYEAVCTGETGHAEVVQIEYDPEVVSYEDLLAVFFTIHDPTTLNRQGPDVGSQYRSAIFTHDDRQQDVAEQFISDLEAEDAYDGDDIVTEVESIGDFYVAEDYHQDYYEKQRTADGNIKDPYCAMYAEPKVQKVREKFSDKVKPNTGSQTG